MRIDVDQPLDLAAELFRWEIATAVAGAELELNPFDQPDVEAAKVAARDLGAYPASKFPLAAYCQQLRLELGPEGLHVLLVCPGPIARKQSRDRYTETTGDLPPAARKPAAGAKVRAIEPNDLAERIITACQRRRAELIVPARARLLFAAAQLSPQLGDWLVKKMT